MADTKPFKPHKPETTMQVKLSAKEADLIKRLRRYGYGRFVVHKADGLLVRLEINESIMLTEEEGLGLEKDKWYDEKGGNRR